MDEKDLEQEIATEQSENIEKDSSKRKESFFSRIKKRREEIKQRALKRVDEEAQKDTEEAKKKYEKKLEEENSENVTASNEEEKTTSPIKKRILNIGFLIFNIVLVVGLLLWNIVGAGDFTPLDSLQVHFWPIVIYLILLVCATLIDVLCVYLLIYKKTYRTSFSLAYKAMTIGRHYDNVIPSAAGGQTFMASYLRRRDVPGAISFYIPMTKLISLQIGWLVVAFFSLVSSAGLQDLSYVRVMSIIGFILGIFAVSAIIFVSVFKSITKKLIGWGCKLLLKMHIIKNYDAVYEKVSKAVEDYQNLMREFTHDPFGMITQIVLHIIRYCIYYSVPFFIFCIFNGFPTADASSTYSTLFITAALIELSASFVPLPGGSGVNEISFTILFSAWLGGETFWALILWRFFNYYNILLQGISVLTYEAVYGDSKYLWTKKRSELQAESSIFKRECIDAFRAQRNRQRKREKMARAK